MSMFRRPKTLAELQEEDERLDTEVSVARKKAMIRQAERQAGKGSWRMFSDNGRASGINWQRMMAWLRGSK